MKRNKNGQFSKTHGKRFCRTYSIWSGMKQRCDNKNCHIWEYYGKLGISYDKKWETFEGFIEDMGMAPVGLSIDRIDSRGNYCKENCRWATDFEQLNNRKNVPKFTYKGKLLSISELSKIAGIPQPTMRSRLVVWKWDVERAVLTPVDKRMSFPKPTKHGTRNRYRKGCTCKKCKEANSAHSREIRARQR